MASRHCAERNRQSSGTGVKCLKVKVLLVEDDPLLADALTTALVRDGASVSLARDAAAARLKLVGDGFEIILLDIGLPDGSGLDVLRFLRARYDTTPVIILTSRDRLSDRIAGLDAGADDYLVKPFQVEELFARMRAVTRRSTGKVAPIMSWGTISLDPVSHLVLVNGVEVPLSVHEFRTLRSLMLRNGKAVSRDVIENEVYGTSGAIGSNTVTVYVHQLRRKVGSDVIETVHGFGYRLGRDT